MGGTVHNKDNPDNSISVNTIGQRIELRIGPSDSGVTRFSKLRIPEALEVADLLVKDANSLAKKNKSKKALDATRRSFGGSSPI